MPPVGFKPTISAGERPAVIVCDLETSRIGAPYIYDISNLRVKHNWNRREADMSQPVSLPLELLESYLPFLEASKC